LLDWPNKFFIALNKSSCEAIQVKTSRIKRIVKEGGTALGAGVLSFSPSVVEVFADAGIDFVWLDLEHSGYSPYDYEHMTSMVRAADAFGISTLVRVPENSESMIAKVLDAGVHAVLVPGVTSVEGATHAVGAAKYFPPDRTGNRGAALSRFVGFKGLSEGAARQADAETMVGIMIEDRATVDNLEAITSVKGLDFGFLGPQDLSISLGLSFQPGHQRVQEYIQKAIQTCKSKGLTLGHAVTDAEAAKKAIGQGFRILRIGQDLQILNKEIQGLLERIKV
jgi:2-keto-3-deoxy-L-rhamnonate aldolase RhmA